jgi:hypothetical protein
MQCTVVKPDCRQGLHYCRHAALMAHLHSVAAFETSLQRALIRTPYAMALLIGSVFSAAEYGHTRNGLGAQRLYPISGERARPALR